MALTRVGMGFLALFFLSGAILLIFLVLLGGSRNSNPLNRIYFLEANTGNIPGAPLVSRWTFWALCSVKDGKNDCGSSHPDFPLDPPSHRNFNTTVNVPPEFIGTNHYFLTTRFMFPFILIGLFFAVSALFTGLLALCTRIGGFISGFLSWLALTFQAITTCLMTAGYVQGRSAFNRNGQTAHLGVKAFAFMWTATACLFLSSLLYCLGGALGGRKDGGYSGRDQRRRGFFSSQRSSSVRSQSAANKKETSPYA